MTYAQLVKLLSQHSLTVNDLTLYDPATKEMVDGSSFLDEFGFHDTYKTADVMAWLGY